MDPIPSRTKRDGVGLPPRPFFYDTTQVAALLSIEETQLTNTLIHFEGRSVGAHRKDMLLAKNLAPPRTNPIWRIAEGELVRWMKFKGIRYYERGWLS